MKKFVSALVIAGLAITSTPASEAAAKATSAKYVKVTKTVKKKVTPVKSKAIKSVYVTTDSSTATTPPDTQTVVAPIDTRTVVAPVETRTPSTPAPASAAVTLSGDQLLKLMELFAKLAVTNNVNTTSNNVITPITVAPQIITQTVVSPTVSAPVTIQSPIQQALTLLSVKKESDDHHESDRHK